jgi:magnesium chelatase family protein
MLARRLPSILPPLSAAEAIEVTRIQSVVGRYRGGGLVAERPFRAPHHSVSSSGLVGGGSGPAPGEATLAHHGVLFLDELSEFARPALEALRQPMEDGRVAIVRGQRTAVFPSRFMLVAATNPCPCGYAAEPERCRCSEADHDRYRRRLSGPLMDRIDIVVDVQRPTAAALERPPEADSATVRAEVVAARERQAARLAGSQATCNAHLDAGEVRRCARLDRFAKATLADYYARNAISARAHDRIVKVARTVADLAGRETVGAQDIRDAYAMRDQNRADRECA